MATTPTPKPSDPTQDTAQAAPAPAEKPIGGPDDLILLDADDKPAEALTREDAGLEEKQKPPFRVQHPKTQQLYERKGTDDQGRATYRPS